MRSINREQINEVKKEISKTWHGMLGVRMVRLKIHFISGELTARMEYLDDKDHDIGDPIISSLLIDELVDIDDLEESRSSKSTKTNKQYILHMHVKENPSTPLVRLHLLINRNSLRLFGYGKAIGAQYTVDLF